MKRTKLFKGLTIFCSITMLISSFVGCGKNAETTEATPDTKEVAAGAESKVETEEEITLTLLQWDNIFTKNNYDVVAEYKKVKPNVTIEIENLKDTGEFEQAMKIRKTANQMPDIFALKPYMLADFGTIAADLSDLEAARDSIYAETFKVDGKIVALPTQAFNEFVWYNKEIFAEYNLEVPKTWDEFIKAAETIKAGGKYIPILMGGKDAWPDYPFNEFMPSLVANDGTLWNKMAEDPQPFTPDKPFYQAYQMIDQLYSAEVFGTDPLGMGFDQVKAMFGTKGAMLCAGQWFLADAQKAMGDKSDKIGTFLLPVRKDASEKLNTITMADTFLSTAQGGKNEAAAKEFINWFLTDAANYQAFTKAMNVNSTMKSIEAGVEPCIAEAFEGVDVNPVIYDGGNKKFQAIQAATKFDVKQIGQEMMSGKDLDELMNNLNKSWQEAQSTTK
jgi:raffinose/stachyose/melibiose transport system substrate-binding protein